MSVAPDEPRACMPFRRENQNHTPSSTANGSQEAARVIQSFIKKVSGVLANQRVGICRRPGGMVHRQVRRMGSASLRDRGVHKTLRVLAKLPHHPVMVGVLH